jgi:shikimate dehydrogenase
MRFVGVSTTNSAINLIFPIWSEILGLDAELRGLDIPIDATNNLYRSALLEMQRDSQCVGALVTTHKIALFNAARDLFESFDTFAETCGEVSSIKITDGKVFGAAKDPITAGLAISEFLDEGHFKDGAEVLCFGDGGAATAIAWYFSGLAMPPAKITFLGIREERLSHLRNIISDRPAAARIQALLTSDSIAKSQLETLAPRSLLINATGMGKDIPGTPIPRGTKFPTNSIVWELNYRGSLEFLIQAKLEAQESNLQVHDGWRYFIHGWSSVIEEVFDIKLNDGLISKLSEAAEVAR